MTDFNKTRWADAEFSREYREKADIFIVERRRMLEIMKSYYRYFLAGRGRNRVLDLGCGDGILTHSLLETGEDISATLIDASADMLAKAQERLQDYKDIHYIAASFQEIIAGDIIQSGYDFVVSSLAIHHLTTDEKRKFFRRVYTCLHKEGYFLNIDVVLPPVEIIEEWYLKLWNEWMDERKVLLGLDRDLFSDITRRYKAYDENKPDTIDMQLSALKKTGFDQVDCFYKYGVFAVYGGRKNSSA